MIAGARDGWPGWGANTERGLGGGFNGSGCVAKGGAGDVRWPGVGAEDVAWVGDCVEIKLRKERNVSMSWDVN